MFAESIWLVIFRTIHQIVIAAVAITCLSLLLYALTFNLRDRVARTFALLLAEVTIISAAEAIASTVIASWEMELWLKLQWVGLVFLPSSYLHLSDALLATTGRPSRWRRRWVIRGTYLVGVFFLFELVQGNLVGPLITSNGYSQHLQHTFWTAIFTLYYAGVVGIAWINFIRAYHRTLTPTSRRRMAYLLVGALAPAIGSYPFMLYGSSLLIGHPIIFLIIAISANIIMGGLIVVMSYAVAFFGIPWPDRVVKNRLFKWILRGPVTASLVLGLVTIVRRLGATFGNPYSVLVPIVLVGSILLFEYLITLFSPYVERWLFMEGDPEDLSLLRTLEDRLMTDHDLRQFLEMIVAAAGDRLRASSAFIGAINPEGLEMVVTTGEEPLLEDGETSTELLKLVKGREADKDRFRWGKYTLVPLLETNEGSTPELLGLMGFSGRDQKILDIEQEQALEILVDRASLALRDRLLQRQVFNNLKELSPNMSFIQQLRAVSRYDRSGMLLEPGDLPADDFNEWVKDALDHYWGGPKLTESPLINLNVVRNESRSSDNNTPNALRSILRMAIEKMKPLGERRFTGEWILYNILDMKFMEGKKVREVAMRLSMSEADLYRKQRVAIEAVARAILEMEKEARRHKA
ncbi:MAG: hypothetical protein JW704_06125 [Anaerolineaceae bacterium]|nr:hypothetical protein [Anaerolineaceae bacterium]